MSPPPPPPPVTVVAVPGNGGGARRFALAGPHMPAGVRLCPITLPGFGGAPLLPAERGRAGAAARLRALTEAEPRPRVLLGHGIGGALALEALQESAAWADGLILHAPVGARLDRRLLPLLAALPGTRRLGLRLFTARLLRRAIVRRLFTRPVPDEFVEGFFDDYRRSEAFAEAFDWFTAPWFRGLRPVSLPTAILWGGRDAILGPRQAEAFQRLAPGAPVRVEAGWGHFPMIDEPEAYARVVSGLAVRLAAERGASP